MTTLDFLLSAAGFVLLAFFGEGVMLFLGGLVFAVLTLGAVQFPGAQDQDLHFPWHGFARNRAGRFVVEPQVAGALGMVVAISVLVIFICWRAGLFASA
ncbi:hypothetical protein ACSFA8_26770 [Variovorax sp. RT4R15]|uniref:hypothetical protein n=1 Tax=Variovorax sp. RT4R15 TaxID=3443737 RepID=UPI003F447FBE